jgi:hypothetical protein
LGGSKTFRLLFLLLSSVGAVVVISNDEFVGTEDVIRLSKTKRINTAVLKVFPHS